MPVYLGSKKVSIQTSVTPEEPSVFIRDPYGNLIAEYIKDEFLLLDAYPTAPTLSGLTFQEYNWTLTDAKNYVRNYGWLDIGATYKPTSNLTEIDIIVDKVSGYNVILNMNGTINWGDGTSDTGSTSTTSHTYTDYGKYTITCSGTINTTTASVGLFGNLNSTLKVVEIRLGTSITILGDYVFGNLTLLKSVIIPNTITAINQYAFNICTFVDNLILPSSLTSIGNYAFTQNRSQTYISMSNSITSMGQNLFASLNNLRRVCLPDNSNLTTFGQNGFNTNYGIETIVVPNSITTLAYSGMYNCPNLKNLVLGNAITSILNSAIGSNSLQELNITSSNTITIGGNSAIAVPNAKKIKITCPSLIIQYGYTFRGNSSVKEIILPNNVTINAGLQYLFSGNYMLEKINIPSTITNLGASSFQNCYHLKIDVELPSGITAIDNYLFDSCYKIPSFTALGKITSVGTSAFSNCYACLKYNFSHCDTVPTLSATNAFNNINKNAQIIVPESLYETWIATTNWVSYANYIYKASEV